MQKCLLSQNLYQFLKDKVSSNDLQFIAQNQLLNRMLGALYGAFIGDSLGSYCDLLSNQFISSNIDTIMKLSGHGTNNLQEGQLTDDSQLSIQLSNALIQCYDQSNDKIIEKIANNYVDWYNSDPIDIGNTCKQAFKIIKHQLQYNKLHNQSFQYLTITQKIKNVNQNSQSNGSLMRILPLSLFYTSKNINHNYHQQQIQNLITKQIQLTHSNSLIINSGISWVFLLQKLISRNSDHQLIQIYNDFKSNYITQDISQWLNQAESQSMMPANKRVGWAKIAWTYGIHYLNKICKNYQKMDKQKIFQTIMRQIILCGGDTDTNSSIVGGLIGSIVGFNKLPFQYLSKILNPNIKLGNFRNDKYKGMNGLSICLRLWKKSNKI